MFEVNLPGTSIHVIDEYNQSTYDTSAFGTTESVLIIGTAFDGPVGKEVAVYNPEHANYIFGGSYDSRTGTTATLTAHVQDAYNKGCRTIYCMRVGGKELSKTYRLKNASPVYLKISSIFPSNKYKDVAMVICDRKLHLLKTANKATIEEKREGAVVSSESIVKVTINLNETFGFDGDSSLSELIQYLNNYVRNNVFKFSLVDAKGVDVTLDNATRTIKVSALFDGLYTIGRTNKKDRNAVIPTIGVSALEDAFALNLTANADIDSMYPYIDAQHSVEQYIDFETYGALDTISQPDAIDYEEVNLDGFELYKRLGSGFAQTAILKNTSNDAANPTYMVQPTPKTHANFSVEISDGIYTVASNLKTDYRILAKGYADSVIRNVRPKVDDFLSSSISQIPVFKTTENETGLNTLYATYKLEDTIQKEYGFKSKTFDGSEVIKNLTFSTIKDGLGEEPQILTLDEVSNNAADRYALVEAEGAYWIAYGPKVVMSLQELFNEERFFLTTIEPSGLEGSAITYTLEMLDNSNNYTSLDTFAEELKESAIGQRFDFSVVLGYENDLPVLNETATLVSNKKIGTDPNLVIPYTTTDNFARQLAQHCEYTSLKTYQTHGIIGVSPINDTSIKSVTQKCASLLSKDYDLYVKNAIGKPVLGVDNMPYHIGKAISITAIQHAITTMDGYNFVSSGQSAYVGRASTLPASTSTTNQILNLTPHFTYSESQKASLSQAGYVNVSLKNGEYKIIDGVTQAPSYSQFSRFATFRTMKLVDDVIRTATEPFIGKNNDMVNRNSMYTAIKSGMDALLNSHIDRYEFSMDYSKQEARLGNINISYAIDIIDEIRNVRNTVTAKSEM